jgi:hypothetical protein
VIPFLLRSLTRLVPVAAVGYTVADGNETMQKAFDDVIAVVYKMKVEAELRGVVKIIKLDIIDGKGLPYSLPEYMRKNMNVDEEAGQANWLEKLQDQGIKLTMKEEQKKALADPGLDPWGTEYHLESRGSKVAVYSCGQDKQCGSKDDIAILFDSQKM